MYKKYIKLTSLLLALLLVISLSACGSSSDQTANEEAQADVTAGAEQENDTDTAASSGSDTLVVYFSRTGEQYEVGVIEKGNTAIVADMIIDKTGADSFEILPDDDHYPYTYDELTDVAKKEQNENARPDRKSVV